MKKIWILLLLLSFNINVVFADCTPPNANDDLSAVPVYFYGDELGVYTIHLSDTLTAIADGDAGKSIPYYKRPWWGDCPSHLSKSDQCTEYTVYPSDTNFSPTGIMTKIEEDSHNPRPGHPNRGEVRILTNNAETFYDYTIDHEHIFCGPYTMPPSTPR